MTGLQEIFIAITFAGPLLLWLLCRRVRASWPGHAVSAAIGVLLLGAYATAFILKWRGEGLAIDGTLPMQLCDWAAFVTLLALARRAQGAFELAYFWGLSGTVQALFTPAVDMDASLRVIAFLTVHSMIPAGVLWLMLQYRLRPRATGVWRALAWSQLYVAAALVVNRLAGANYGFLSSKPVNPSLLDLLPDHPVLYVLGMEVLALLFFTVLQVPWWFVPRRGTADA